MNVAQPPDLEIYVSARYLRRERWLYFTSGALLVIVLDVLFSFGR